MPISPHLDTRVCCHEAAHIFYFTMAGMKNYDAFPAKLYYDPATGDYEGTLASIKPCDLTRPTTEADAEKWLWTVMKAHAAGGVVARKLAPALPDHGDEEDKNRFMNLCKRMKTSVNPEYLWKQAQEAVSKELVENPKAFAGLEKFATEELRPLLGLS